MFIRTSLLSFFLFATSTATACQFYCPDEAKLAGLEGRGFPAGTNVFHGKVQRWINAREVDVEVVEAFSGNRETKHLIGPPISDAWCDGSTFSPDEEAIYISKDGSINACSRAKATAEALARLRAIAARSGNVDQIARNARFEASVRAASAAAQQRDAQRTSDEETLRKYKGVNLLKPARLRSLDPDLANSLRTYEANEEFVNIHTVHIDRLAIDSPITIFEVDGKQLRFVGKLNHNGAPTDVWEGRTLSGDTAGISRNFDLMLGEIQAGGRRFRVVAFGDFGFVAELNPVVVAEREADSRFPQEMARARLAKERAEREAALHQPLLVQPVYTAAQRPPGPAAPRASKEQECASRLQFMSRLDKYESYRQPPHFRLLLAQNRAAGEQGLIENGCKRSR